MPPGCWIYVHVVIMAVIVDVRVCRCSMVDGAVMFLANGAKTDNITDEMHWLSDTKLVNCLVKWSTPPPAS